MPENPLFDGMPARLSKLDLALALTNQPRLLGTDAESRRALIDAVSSVFSPTKTAVNAAFSLQNMVYESLAARNPLKALSRRRVGEVTISEEGWTPDEAMGGIFQGYTGCGKSFTWERLTSLWPQVIEHGSRPDCGWERLHQLVYLRVELSHDGSPKGFLAAAFHALDKALGTNYTALHLRERVSVDSLLVSLLRLLIVHRCGVLILEEAQREKLATSAFADQMLSMLLRILNTGIPLLLVGNPLAFKKVMGHGQLQRRFACAGIHDFAPTFDPIDPDWREGLFPAVWKCSVFQVPDELGLHDFDLQANVWRLTGGSHDLLRDLRKKTLEVALEDAGATRVTWAHILTAANRSNLQKLRGKAELLATHDFAGLANAYTDFPHEFMERMLKASQERVRLRDAVKSKAPPSGASEVGAVPFASMPEQELQPDVSEPPEVGSGTSPSADLVARYREAAGTRAQ